MADRRTHTDNPLDEALAQIRMLIREGQERRLQEVSRACLATATAEGKPSVRTIYITAIREDGLVFFVNTESGKGRQLSANPQAALCFFWPEMQEQVTVEGTTELLSEAESNRLWQMRPRDSQLAAWASNQARASEARPQRMEKREWIQHQHAFDSIPRPDTWRAVLLRPGRFEFWATGWQHLRTRTLYENQADGSWQVQFDNP